MGKIMEKAGRLVHSEALVEKGAVKREEKIAQTERGPVAN